MGQFEFGQVDITTVHSDVRGWTFSNNALTILLHWRQPANPASTSVSIIWSTPTLRGLETKRQQYALRWKKRMLPGPL